MRKLTATTLGFNAVYVVSQAIIARRLGPVAHDALRLQTTTSAAKFLAPGPAAAGQLGWV